MGPTPLLPLRRKSCYGFLSPLETDYSTTGGPQVDHRWTTDRPQIDHKWTTGEPQVNYFLKGKTIFTEIDRNAR
jgi:hypothetical protein